MTLEGSTPSSGTKSDETIQSFLAATGRDKKEILKLLLVMELTRDQEALLAPAVRDRSPRVCARVTSLLARNDLRDRFEEQLEGLKPGKVMILRSQFEKLHRNDDQKDKDSD